MGIKLGVVLLVTAMTAGCATLNFADKEIRISGGDAAVSGTILPAKETFEEETGMVLTVKPTEPGKELLTLASGSIDAIVSSASVADLLKEMTNPKDIDSRAFQEVAVGKNETVVLINKKINVKKLTKKQLKSIFTGKITNWRQVGGPKRPIVVVWKTSRAGDNDAFVKDLLDGATIASRAVHVETFEEVRKKVIATPGAIGICPQGFIAPAIMVPRTPLVASDVVIITKGKPSPKAQKLIEFLQDVAYFQ